MRRFIPFHPAQIASVVAAVCIVLALVLPTLVFPPTAAAQVAQSASFASAVPCLNTTPTFAHTRFEDTMFDSPTPATYPGVQTVAPGGTPISQATLAQLGSVYSLAYDDGAASGRERLFAAAYTRRLVNYGPRGPGGIYILERSGGAWAVTGSFSVPGASGVPRTVGFAPFYDGAAIPGVGRTSLGGMVVSPDGQSLYVVNIGARRIERYTLTASGTPTHSGQFAIPFNRISGDPIVQADLYPFALQFYPFGAEQVLLVGVTDTAYRAVARGAGGEELDPIFNPDGSQQIPPSAHVLMLNLRNGAWSLAVSQSLDTPALRQRTFASDFYTELSAADRERTRGWNPWRDRLDRIPAVGDQMRYPQPILTNIELVRERAPTATEPDPAPLMLLGFRDRTGDVAFNNALTVPGGERTAVAQGDVLALRAVGGAWTVVGNDYYQDNALPNDPGSSRHIENFSGAMARIPAGGTGIGTAGDTLTMFGLGGQRTTGMYTLPNTAATGGAGSYTNLINVGGRAATKATNLGDVEVLCSYALVGGRVWDDRNTNSVQDAGEPGIANVRLEVFQGNNPRTAATILAATTDAQGRYLFALPPNTPYNIRIAPASRTTLTAQGYRFTRTQVGSNRTADSDASQVWGYIEFARPGQSQTGAGLPLPLRESDQRSYDIGLMRQQPAGRIGDFVWNDLNANGIQDAGEPGIGGVTVTLEGVDSVALGAVNQSATTDSNGLYLFDLLPPGVYRVRFSVPTGMRPTLLQRGGNSARDSDADTSTSLLTPRFNLLENQETLEWDFGLLGNADVTITKTGPATAVADATFDYTLSYRNVGSSSATNVVVEDVLPSGLTFVSATPAPSSVSGQTLRWNLGTLNAGATGSIQLRVRAASTFSPASATSWERTNCVQISATPVDANSANNQSCANTTLQRPEISVTKTGPATAAAGATFDYTLSYRNVGSSSATNVVVEDVLPSGLTFVSATPAPSSVSGQTLRWNLGTLNAGATGSIQLRVRAASTFSPASATSWARTNCVQISATPVDANSANNQSCANTTLQRPEISVTKTGPATAAAGATFDYTLSYRNVGSSSATNVVVEDVLPSGLTFVSATPAPSSVSGQTLRWNLGTLNAGATGSIQLRVRAASTFSPASATSWARTNCVQISATPVDANSANNQSCANTTLQRPEISVTKTAPATVVIGDTFTYQLVYRNTGTVGANAFSLIDNLPTGLTFIVFTQNPNNACTYAAGQRRITCSEAILPAGASRTVAFTVRADPAATATSAVNTASVNTTSTGDDPSNNTSTTTTAIQSPNVGTSISITPSPWPVGTTSTIRPTFRNTGDGTATSSVLTVTLPPTGTFTVSGLPTGCTYAGATRIVTCALGDLPPGASGNRPFTVNLPPDFPADSFTASAEIRTATPERTTDLSDNTATTTVSVVRPNVWVGAMGPDRIVGQGSVFWYVVDYGNQYFRTPSLTRAAENTLLRVTLPPDVTYQGVNGTPPTRINGQVLEWDLGTLNPRATGQLTIVVQTNVPAGAVLDFEAVISTTTPGDDPRDNRATVRTDVVQPPAVIPNAGGDLRLAIHSELDPNSQDGDAFNGVYISTGTAITWPAGEVLDFTPRLLDLQMDGGSLPWPYEYRARVVGWSVTGFTVNGTVRNPQAADSRGRAGCRPGAAPSRNPLLLTGCRYAYLGGEDLASIANPQRLREDQMASQAHVYWTQPPAPRQRDDVFLYTLDPIEGVDIRVQVEVEVWIVNAYPGAPINDPSLPEIPIVPLPDPERRLIEQTFDVTLLVPRSVIGPGSVTR